MKTHIYILLCLLFINDAYGQIENECFSDPNKPIPYSNYYNAETYKPGWELVFSDEFNDGTVDPIKWKITEKVIRNGIPTNTYTDASLDPQYFCSTCVTSPTYERQYYLKDNVVETNGNLQINILHNPAGAVYEVNDDLYHKYYYTSGEVFFKEKTGYGYYEFRCKLPKGEAFWPAIWLFAGPPYNEIDIYENAGVGDRLSPRTCFDGQNYRNIGDGSDEIAGNIHVANSNFLECDDNTNEYCKIALNPDGDFNYDNFYTVGMEWGPDEIRWYINGYLGRIVKKGQCEAYPTNPMNLIIGCAIEGWTGDVFLPTTGDGVAQTTDCSSKTIFPGEFQIDYFRYYKKSCEVKPGLLDEDPSNQLTRKKDFCVQDGYNDNDSYPRLIADFNGDNKADILGFNTNTVSVALSDYHNYEPNYIFTTNNQNITSIGNIFTQSNGWLSQLDHPRMTGDFNGDNKADIIGFNNYGTWAAFSTSTSTTASFQMNNSAHNSISFYGIQQGFTNQLLCPRFIADIDGDNHDDIVGINETSVYVSLAFNPALTNPEFKTQQLVLKNFCQSTGYYDMELYPRYLADVDGDRLPDLVGINDYGVYVSINNSTVGNPVFAAPVLVIQHFAISQNYQSQEINPRFLADVNGDGKADIIGFGNDYTEVSLSTSVHGTAPTFDPQAIVLSQFNVNNGWPNNSEFPRMMADVNCDGKSDIIGFWENAVMVSLSRTDLSPNFANYQVVTDEFTKRDKYADQNTHPRFIAELKGDCGGPEIIGFGEETIEVFDCLSSVCDENNVAQNTCYIPEPDIEFTMIPKDDQFFPIEHFDQRWRGCRNSLFNEITGGNNIDDITYTDGNGVYVYIKGYVKSQDIFSLFCNVYNNTLGDPTYNLAPIDCSPVNTEGNMFLCENPVKPYIWHPDGNGNIYFEFKIPINSAHYTVVNNFGCGFGIDDNYNSCSQPSSGTFAPPELKEWKFELQILNPGGIKTYKTISGLVCGDLFVIDGQSNAVANVDDAAAIDYNDDLDGTDLRRFMRSYGGHKEFLDAIPQENWKGWGKSSALWWDDHYSGVLGMRLQENIVHLKNRPVGIINGAIAGTLITQHLRDADPLKSTLEKGFDNMNIYRHQLLKLNSDVQHIGCRISESGLLSQVKGIIWYQGESDCYDEQTICNYSENFRNLYNSFATDLPDVIFDNGVKKNTKFYLLQLNTADPDQNADWNGVARIRETQRQLGEKYHKAFLSDGNSGSENVYDVRIMSTVGNAPDHRLPYPDAYHYTLDGYKKIADNLYNMINLDFYDPSISPADVEPPNIVKAYYDDPGNPKDIILEFDAPVFIQPCNVQACVKDYFFDETGNRIPITSCTVNAGNNMQVILELDQSALPPPYPGYAIPFKKISYLPSGEYYDGTAQGSNIIYSGPWIMNASTQSVGALAFHQFPLENDNDGADRWTSLWKNNSDGYMGKWELKDKDIFCIADFDESDEGDEVFIKAEPSTNEKMALLNYDKSRNTWSTLWKNYNKVDNNNFPVVGYYNTPPVYDFAKYYSINSDGVNGDELLAIGAQNGSPDNIKLYDWHNNSWIEGNNTGLDLVYEGYDAGEKYSINTDYELTIGDFNDDGKQDILAFYEYDISKQPLIKVWQWTGTWELLWSTYDCTAHDLMAYKKLSAIDINGDGKDELLAQDSWWTLFEFEDCTGPCGGCSGILGLNQSKNFNWKWSTYGCTEQGISYFGNNGLNGAPCSGFQIPLTADDKLLIGDIDGNLNAGDNFDELFFIQSGPTAQWATSMDFNDQMMQWNWNYSINPTSNTFSIKDWTLADDGGSATSYHLINLEDDNNNERKSLMCLRRTSCDNYNMAIYEASGQSTNYRSSNTSIQQKSESSILLYPVPAKNQLNVKFIPQADTEMQMQILDAYGRVILTNGKIQVSAGFNHEEKFDLTNYANGIYFISVVSNQGIEVERFVISK